MKHSLLLLLCVFSFVVKYGEAQECPTDDKIVVCYYASWSHYREDLGHYNISNIDPFLCTHIVYTFAGLDINSHIYSLDPDYDITAGGFQYFVSLKSVNPCLKLMLAIGGWNEGSRKYSVMASTPESRKAFVEGVLRFIVTYNFDGFDFDWEYPVHRGGIPEDREHFTELLKLLRQRFDQWGLLLSIAVPFGDEVADKSYEISKIKDYVDYVSIMAYDFTPSDSPKTGLIAPLTSIDASITHWISEGFPANKLVLGLASYARTYKLLDADDHGIGSPTNGPGVGGTYTMEKGFLSYYELLPKLESSKFTKVEIDGNNYAYSKLDWMTYDTIQTYKIKVFDLFGGIKNTCLRPVQGRSLSQVALRKYYKEEMELINYALEKKLGGLMLWTLDTDDFLGEYGRPYPILNTINEVFKPSPDYRQFY